MILTSSRASNPQGGWQLELELGSSGLVDRRAQYLALKTTTPRVDLRHLSRAHEFWY
jgi:hypothetical protein